MSSLETADRTGDIDGSLQHVDTASSIRDGADGVRPADAGSERVASQRAHPSWTIAAAILVAIARYLYSHRRFVFSMAPDEMAAAGIARFLVGERWLMLTGNLYRPGLSTLLAPVFAVVDDPDWRVRIALMINAAIAGITMFWFVPLVRRLTPFGPRGALIAATAIALMPSSLSASGYVWAEPLVTLCFLATALAIVRFYDQPSARSAIVSVVWPAVGYTAHGRLLPVVFLAIIAVAGGAAVQRRYRVAAAALSVGTLAYVGSYTYQRWVVSNVWLFAGDGNTSSGVVERLRHPLQVLDSAIGQVWYQLAASALLAGFGGVQLVRRLGSRQDLTCRRDAAVVLYLTVPLMAVSMIFMSDRARADHVVYGRYNDAIMWPVIAVGAGWLFHGAATDRAKTRWFTLGGVAILTIELGLLLRQLHYLQFRVSGVEPMIAGITPAGGSAVKVLLVTAIALAAGGVLWAASLASRRWPVGAVAIVLGLVAVAGVRGWATSESSANGWRRTAEVREITELGLDFSTPIGVSIMPDEYEPGESTFFQQAVAMMYQWYLPEYEFAFDNGPRDNVGPYVFAVTNDALLTRDGGRIVWLSPSHRIALWLEPETLPDGDPNPAYANLEAARP